MFGDLALQVWLESCVPSFSRKTTLLCAVRVDDPDACVWLQLAALYLSVWARWFSHLSVYQGHLEGLQSPILLDLSPQSVLGET